MSSGTPPSPFFSGINFNPLFFQKVIVQYLTETIANTKYLMLSGLNYMTGNLGIKRAAGVELDVNGKAHINNSFTGLPDVGVYGGNATKLILFQGSAIDTPVALGVDGSSLWYGSYSTGSHIFYTGTTERMRIISSGNVGIGVAVPVAKLHLHNSGTNQEVMLRFTDTGTGTTITDGCAIYKSTANDLLLNNFENNKIIFATNNINRASIQSTGEFFVENSLIVGNANSYPNIQLGSTTGYNIGVSSPLGGSFSTSAAAGDMVIRSTGKLLFQSGLANCAMCINTNNYIHIGTGYTTATFPITLNSILSVGQSMTAPFTSGIYSGISTAASGTITPNIYIGLMNTAAFSVGFYIYSDKRIKKDFEPINNSLETIEKINLTSFRYIDWKQKGNIKNYGIIAQEVEEIIPEVINKHKDFIPNIYKNAEYYDGINTIYIKTDDLSIGDKIKIYDDKNKEHIKEVIDINEDYITIDSPIEDYEEDSPLFIYGKEIPDVKNVNYEALFVINMRATQELYKRLKALEKYFNIVY